MVSVYIALKVCCVEGMNASSLVGLKVTRKSVQEKDKKIFFPYSDVTLTPPSKRGR